MLPYFNLHWLASNLQFNNPCQLRHVLAPAAPDPIRPVEEITPVTQRRFGILIDRNDDRLHMRVAPAFPRRLDANLRQGF